MNAVLNFVVKVLSWFSTTIINIKSHWVAKDFGAIFLLLLFLVFIVVLTYLIKQMAKESSGIAIFLIILVVFFVSGFISSYFEKPCVGDTCSIENNGLTPTNPNIESSPSIPVINLNQNGSGY